MSGPGLRIGDIVYIQTAEIHNTWVCGEGLLTDDVFLTQNENLFGNCLWEVHVQCQYSASKEFQELQASIMMEEEEVEKMDQLTRSSLMDKMVQLNRSAWTEKMLNSKLMTLKSGKPVHFGDIIQLRHLKSRKFLSVSSTQLAKQERENMRVINDNVGTSLSAMTIQPKSRSDKEGMQVRSGSECFLRIHEKSSEFLRAVKKISLSNHAVSLDRFEINCSQEFTAWNIHLFQPRTDVRDKLLMTHWPLLLQDGESLSNLTVIAPPPSDPQGPARVVTTPLASRTTEFQSLYVGTEFLWTIEKDLFSEGGLIQFANKKVVIRHFNTKLFLQVNNDGTMCAVKDRLPGTMFEIHQGASEHQHANSEPFLTEGAVFCISTPGQKKWVCTGISKILNHEEVLSTLCEVAPLQSQAIRLTASKSAYVKIDADLYFGAAVFERLWNFVDFSNSKLSPAALAEKKPLGIQEVYGQASTQVRSVLSLVDEIVNFLGGPDSNPFKTSEGQSQSTQSSQFVRQLLDFQLDKKFDHEKISVRQNMMLEQGVLDVILDVLEQCKAGLFDQVKLVAALKENTIKSKTTASTISRVSSVREIIRRDSSVKNLNAQRSGSITEGTVLSGRKETPSKGSMGGSGEMQVKGVLQLVRMMSTKTLGNGNSPYKVGPSSDSDDDSDNDSKSSKDSKDSAERLDQNLSDSRRFSVQGRQLSFGAPSPGALARRFSAAQAAVANRKSVDIAEMRQTMSEELAQAFFRVLLLCAKGNHLTQLHLSTRLKVILGQVASQYLAVKTLKEMLRDNSKILHTRIFQDDIDIMVGHLAQHEMNVVFLKLLQCTCSCPQGVDMTQRMVVLSLFGETEVNKSMVIDFVVDESIISSANWSPSVANTSLGFGYNYIPNAEGPVSIEKFAKSIMGYKLVRYGSPKVFATWGHGTKPGADARIAMVRLFGMRDRVPLELINKFVGKNDLATLQNLDNLSSRKSGVAKRNSSVLMRGRVSVGIVSSGSKHKPSAANVMMAPTTKKSSIDEIKTQVADFLVAQLYLVADLCLDRNYVSIRILEQMYPYDMLISMLKNDFLSNTLKAPICRIIRTLWVDREPQVAMVFPNLVRLTRKNSSISNFTGEFTPSNAKAFSSYTFCLVQQIISEYLWINLNDSKRDEYSFEILELLQYLMKFGFYSGDHKKLQDITIPIARVMDGIKNASSKNRGDEKVEKDAVEENLTWYQRTKGYCVNLVKAGGSQIRSSFTAVTNFSLQSYWESRRDKRLLLTKMSKAASSTGGQRKQNLQQGSAQQVADEFWEERLLSFLDSISGMIFTLSIVLVTCSLSISQFFADDNDMTIQNFYDGLDIAVTCYFATELILRIYSSLMTNVDPTFFFRSPFNFLDFSLVALDLILIGIGSNSNLIGAARVTRVARVLRLLRLLRILRALRLLKKIADVNRLSRLWKMPIRYDSLNELDVKSIVSMLRIMCLVYSHIQEEEVDVLCRSFLEWSDKKNENGANAPVEIYKKINMSVDASTIPPGFDLNLMDILMYSDAKITSEALQLLMMHKNSKQMLFDVVQDIQLVCSGAVETIYTRIRTILRDLQRITEMYEIWQDLDTEEHLETCTDMLKSIELFESLMSHPTENTTLTVEALFEPNPESQNIARSLRAMDCIIGAFKTMFDGGREDLDPKILTIMNRLSDCVVAFVKDHPRNQTVAMLHLSWFIDRIDDGFSTNKCIRAILYGNNLLIGECNPSYIQYFAQKIITGGRKHMYLSFLLGVCELRKSEARVINARPAMFINDISRILTGKEWKDHTLLWVCSPTSKAYADRSSAMDEFKYSEYPPTFEELSPELAYHVELLKLFYSCRLGHRLQAIFPVDHILVPILEPNCIPQLKLALGNLMIQILMSGVDNIDLSENMWCFFEMASSYLESCMKKVTSTCAMKLSEMSVLLRVQMCDWIDVILQITIIFFEGLDMSIFGEISEQDTNFALTIRTDQEVMKVIKSLYMSIRQLMEFHANLLGLTVVKLCGSALLAIVPHSSSLNYEVSDYNSQLSTFKKDNKTKNIIFKRSEDLLQWETRRQFARFTSDLLRSEQSSIYNDSVEMFSKVPLISDPIISDVRFEVLIQKFYGHVKSLLVSGELSGQKNISTDQTVWILKSLRLVLKKELAASGNGNSSKTNDSSSHFFGELSKKDKGLETKRASELRGAFIGNHLMKLCIECCMVGVNSNVCREAVNLLVSVLGWNGSNEAAQSHIYEVLDSSDSSQFFKFVESYLDHIMIWCKKERDESFMYNGDMEDMMEGYNVERDYLLPDEIHILELLRLLCEGDFHPLKNFMRGQERNIEQVNVISKLATITDLLSRHETPGLTIVAIKVFLAVRNIIYGLNKGNQEFLILQTEIVPSINRFMRTNKTRDFQDSYWFGNLEYLKEVLLDVFVCAMEGHSIGSPIFERIINGIELNVLSTVLTPQLLDTGNAFSVDDIVLTTIESKYLQMLETLGKSKEVLTELGWHQAKENIMKVEVVRHGKLHNVYFQLPEVAEHLPEEFVKTVSQDLDVSSHENKMLDFMLKIKMQFIETKYQSLLKPYGLAQAWTFRLRIQLVMFINAVVMNGLVLAYYSREAHFQIPPGDVNDVVETLNIIQISLAALVAFLFFFIRVPASYVSLRENGQSQMGAAWNSSIGDLTLFWRLAYLMLTVVSEAYNHIFLTFLLLDWVALDATTRQVLKAVQYPLRQLAATLFITLIVANIFAGAYFTLFNHDSHEVELETMFDAFKLAFSYGVRGEYGMGHEFHFSLNERIILDVGFYFIVLAILRNSFMAIIVDTFGKLRELQYERDLQANNSCFICGVEKHEFDSANSFNHHRKVTHKALNYVYFVLGIWSQDPSQDNGLQMHVRKCLQVNDVSWFPIGIISQEEITANSYHLDDGDRKDLITDKPNREQQVDRASTRSPTTTGTVSSTGHVSPLGSMLQLRESGLDNTKDEDRDRLATSTVNSELALNKDLAATINSTLSNFSQRLDDLSGVYKQALLQPRNTTTPQNLSPTLSTSISASGDQASGIEIGASPSMADLTLSTHRFQALSSTSSQSSSSRVQVGVIQPSPQRATLIRPRGESPYATTLQRIRSVQSGSDLVDGPSHGAIREETKE